MISDDVSRSPRSQSGTRSRPAWRLILPAALLMGLALPLAGCKSSEEKAAEYYQSGLDLLAAGDPDRAIVQFRNVFDVEGTHYEARKTLAETLMKQGDLRGAYSQYLRLAEQYPDDLAVRIALARMAFNSGDLDEFERHATRAVELSPDDPDVHVLDLAMRYRKAGEAEEDAPREAIAAEVGPLLAERPDDVILLSMALDEAGRNNDLDRAGPLVEKLLDLQPDNRLRYRQRLALLMEKGDMAGAEAQLLATIDRFPDDNDAKADLIRFYLSQNQPDKAEDFMRRLADAAPVDDPAPRTDLIRFVQLHRGDEAALTEVDKALEAGGDPLVFGVLKAGFDFNAGRRDEAIARIRSLLEGVEPSDRTRDIRAQLAQMLVQTGDVAGAKTEVDTVLAANPSHPAALKLKAGWAIENDNTDSALLDLRNVLDQNPEDAEAMGLMATAYARSGETDLARDYLAQAAKASDGAPGPCLRLAQALASEGRWRPAEDALIAALKQNPQNLDLLALLGRVYLEMPDLPRAQGVIAQLREIDSPEAKTAADELDLNRIAAADGQDAAMSYLEGLADGADADQGAKLGLIRARLASGDMQGASKLAADLVAEYPDDTGVLLVQAMTKAAAGDIAAARTGLNDLIAKDPQDPRPYLALMRLDSQQDDPEAARATMDKGLAALPDNPDLLWAKAGFLEREGDIDGAIAIYDDLYRQNSGSVVVANNLASLLATWKSDDPEAVARAETVSRRLRETTVPAFMDTYGWVRHLSGDSESALPYLEGAAASLQGDPMVQIHLGLAQAALGRTDDARAQLQKGLDMLPPDRSDKAIEDARAALTRLDAPQDAAAGTAPEAAANGATDTGADATANGAAETPDQSATDSGTVDGGTAMEGEASATEDSPAAPTPATP